MGDKLLNFLFTNEKLCLRKFKLLDHRSDTNNLQRSRSNPYFLRVLLWFKDASALKIKKKWQQWQHPKNHPSASVIWTT